MNVCRAEWGWRWGDLFRNLPFSCWIVVGHFICVAPGYCFQYFVQKNLGIDSNICFTHFGPIGAKYGNHSKKLMQNKVRANFANIYRQSLN